MPARELPILITAKNETARAATEAAQNIRGMAAEVNRANAAGGGGGAGAGGSGGQASAATLRRIQQLQGEAEESWRDQAKELGKTAKLLKKGGGAFLAVNILSHTMEGVAKTLDEYRENVKQGMAPLQAFTKAFEDNIPVIGAFMKAGNEIGLALRRAMNGPIAEETLEKRKENDQQNRDIRDKMRDEKQRHEGQVFTAGDEAERDARDRLRLAGKEGPQREAEQARIDYERKIRDANKLEGSAKSLGKTEDQDKVKQQAALARQAAEADLQDKLNEIARKGSEEAIKADMDSRERIKDMQHEANQARLQEEGKFVAAKLDQIDQAYDKEMSEIQKRQMEMQKNLSASDPRYKIADTIAARDSKAADDRRNAERSKAQATDSEENKHQQELVQKKRDTQLAADKTLHGAQMDLYRAAGAAGNQELAREAKKQEILENQAEKLREIQVQMQKPDTTDAQRKELLQAQQTVKAGSAIELVELANRKEQTRLSAFTETRGASGLGSLLRENASNQKDSTLGDIKSILEQLKQPQEFFGSVWDSLVQKYPTLKAVIDPANGGTSGGDFFRAPLT